MFTNRRRAALGFATAAAVASMLALSAPAQAVTVPAWPTGGHVPTGTGCVATNVAPNPDGVLHMMVTDTGQATISDVWFNSGSTVTVGPAGTTYSIRMKVVQQCTGVELVTAILVHGAAWVVISPTPLTTNVFDGLWGVPVVTKPSYAGLYKIPIANTGRRYDAIILRSDFTMVGGPLASSALQLVVGPWSTKSLYVLRATTMTNTLSATKVAKGKAVKATAVLKHAVDGGYAADVGGKAVVQTKVGSGKWVSKATLTANASGVVAYSFVLSATTQVRFLHPRTLSGSFTEAVTSAIRTVTKA
jgi:hypothetical protein